MLRRLPSGFTATATVQVAGRGRGSNVWVSPAGSLMFSTCIRHPMSITPVAPVVFIQYLAALAIVEGVKSYDIGYQDMPLKLKWPNDICASQLPSSLGDRSANRLIYRRARPNKAQGKGLRQNRRHPRQLALFLQRIPLRCRHRPQHHQRFPNDLSQRSDLTPADSPPAALHPREIARPHPHHFFLPLRAFLSYGF